MYKRKALVKRLDIPENRRILVISDIHGNMEYFRGVLEKAGFTRVGENTEYVFYGFPVFNAHECHATLGRRKGDFYFLPGTVCFFIAGQSE